MQLYKQYRSIASAENCTSCVKHIVIKIMVCY